MAQLTLGWLSAEYSDDFELMTDEELRLHFGSDANRCCVKSGERHAMLSFSMTKPNALLSVLTNSRSVANGLLMRIKKNQRDFRQTDVISAKICGKTAEGFRYEITVPQRDTGADVRECCELLVFRHRSIFYVLSYYSNKETDAENRIVWDGLLASVSLE